MRGGGDRRTGKRNIMDGEEEKGSWMVKGRKKMGERKGRKEMGERKGRKKMGERKGRKKMGERKWRSQGEKIKEKRKV